MHAMGRVIMHVDMDAFFCAVEELLNPALHGVAFAVGGAATGRGVISSASYPARKLGIHSAMPTSQALKVAPGLIVVGHRHDTYGNYSRRFMSILREYTNTLQQISVDEAWVDVTGFETAPRALALEIQKRISIEVGLPCSIGIATSKLVSKMASSRAKPAGVLQIPAGGEAAFLAPMAVGELWGVGEATAARLKEIGIATIGDMQRAGPSSLSGAFGNNAAGAVARANGIDDSPVQEDGRELTRNLLKWTCARPQRHRWIDSFEVKKVGGQFVWLQRCGGTFGVEVSFAAQACRLHALLQNGEQFVGHLLKFNDLGIR